MGPPLRTALRLLASRFEAHTYAGTQHGFHNNSTPRYNEAAAKLSWDRTVEHFAKHTRLTFRRHDRLTANASPRPPKLAVRSSAAPASEARRDADHGSAGGYWNDVPQFAFSCCLVRLPRRDAGAGDDRVAGEAEHGAQQDQPFCGRGDRIVGVGVEVASRNDALPVEVTNGNATPPVMTLVTLVPDGLAALCRTAM